MKESISVRAATPEDIDAIFHLLEKFSGSGVLLPRSREDIAFYLGNFQIAERGGEIVGCAAVRDFGNDLLEVRSLAVRPDVHGQGVGKAMIRAIIERLRRTRDNWRLFALTMRPDFFRSRGFREVPKALFPEKIWSDCAKCAKRHRCDEVAMLLDSSEVTDGQGN